MCFMIENTTKFDDYELNSWWHHEMEMHGALCEGKSTSHRWISLTKGQKYKAWIFSITIKPLI